MSLIAVKLLNRYKLNGDRDMRFLIPLMPVLLIGCASESELKMGYDAQMKAADIQAVVMREQPPTFSIDCSAGCGNAKIDYLDPRDRHKLILPRVTNTNDTIIHSLKPAVTALGYVAGAVTAIRVADDIFNATGSGNNEVHNTNITNGDNNTNDMVSTTTRSTADHNVSSNDNNQDNDVAYTDSQNDNSVNNQDDNSTVSNDSHDQTATPTIVETTDTTTTTIQTVEPIQPTIVQADGTCIGLGCD